MLTMTCAAAVCTTGLHLSQHLPSSQPTCRPMLLGHACRSASMARAPNDSTYTPGRCTAPTTCTATDVGGCSLTVLADAELTSTALTVVLTPARGNAVSTGGAGTRRKRTRTIVPATTATAAPTIRESPTHAIHRRDSRNHRFSLSCNSCTSAMCAA